MEANAFDGQYSLVYLSPELASGRRAQLQALHERRGVCLLAIDEAHCVSEWGHDFRPDYRHLGALREALPGVPLLALTATATAKVRGDIRRSLRMAADAAEVVESFDRPNLFYSVTRKQGSVTDNFQELIQELSALDVERGEVQPTIIYTITVKLADDIGAALQEAGIRRVGVYHAKKSMNDRTLVHKGFLHDELTCVVATVAFGMGTNKPNVRRVIHFGAPKSLEAYYQQVRGHP